MKTKLAVLTMLGLTPGLLAGQQNPVERLGQVLPEEQSEQVIALVENALSRGLPGWAIAERVLEGIAKGRSGEEVLAAAQDLVSDLTNSQAAIEAGGRSPNTTEIEAGANALALGVDGALVSELAAWAPSGRSLAVPLVVIGALTERGLPANDALAAVQAQLKAAAGDLELIALPEEAGRMLAEGMMPTEVGVALASAHAGLLLPPGVPLTPPGPPAGVPTNGGAAGERPTPPTPPVPPNPASPNRP